MQNVKTVVDELRKKHMGIAEKKNEEIQKLKD